MKNYIRYILPVRTGFRQITINRRDLILLENAAVKHLRVRDLNELRDRFEGQAFLDNYIGKALPIMGLQKYLKTDFIDFEIISPEKIKSEIIIDGTRVSVIQFGHDLPLIDTSMDLPCIFIYCTQKQVLELTGYASAQVVRNHIFDVKKYGFGSKETVKGSFYGFDKLKMFENIEDLVRLINH